VLGTRALPWQQRNKIPLTKLTSHKDSDKSDKLHELTKPVFRLNYASITKFTVDKERIDMPALNRVQLIGHLGKDPESKFTPTGKKVTHFSLAVSQRWRTGGETKEYTEWVNIEAWGRLGEVSQEYLKKGSLVYMEGRLKTEKYEDKDGEKKFYTKVVALSLQFLDKKDKEEPVMAVEEETVDYEA
jgi:single-strand DNA-binding protein